MISADFLQRSGIAFPQVSFVGEKSPKSINTWGYILLQQTATLGVG
jgi:hypothetical protein